MSDGALFLTSQRPIDIMRRAMRSDFWQSWKYNFDDYDWRELQSLYIEDLGAAVSSLKKSWRQYKLAILQGDEAAAKHYSLIINRVQDALGLPLSSFL